MTNEFYFIICCLNNAQRWKYTISTGNFHLLFVSSDSIYSLQILKRRCIILKKSLVCPTAKELIVSVNQILSSVEHSKLPLFLCTLYCNAIATGKIIKNVNKRNKTSYIPLIVFMQNI